jgi:tRNA(Ile2) C34 agmatinyltransferase TiaS
MIQIQPICPVCGGWDVMPGRNNWNQCYGCGVWFNTETGEEKWCLFDSPEDS